MTLRAPFPWFGGKSRAAHLVWAAFGDVPNYVEPFAGSLAVLLGRPSPPRIETVNDIDAHLSNFWRAVQAAPEDVARWADWPVNEADLHARHRWLVGAVPSSRELIEGWREKMKHDPDHYDAKIAGWWVWGICQWIGSGWCAQPEWWARANEGEDYGDGRRPHLGTGQGANAKRARNIAGASEWAKRPALGKGSRGIQGADVREQIPMLRGDSGAAGAGIHASGLEEKMPKMDRGTLSRMQPDVGEQMPDLGGNGGAAGKGVTASAKDQSAIVSWMLALQQRLRRVRVCCGDWKRVLGRSPTECIGLTGVFLDPPYGDADRDPRLYSHDSMTVAAEVAQWAREHGDNPKLRIALCGYEGEHEMPASWQCVAWKATGGYAASAGNSDNARKERIWFSPACFPVVAAQGSLFAK